MKPTISKPFKSNDRTFDKVYNAFDKRDYFNSQGLAKVQIGNFERALQKNDKGAQQVLDLFKGDKKKAKDYITQVVSDRNKERAFNNYKALKSAVDSIQKGKPNVGAVDYVKRIIHNSSQKYSIALYSTLRNKKFTKWKDVHDDIDDLIGESVNEDSYDNNGLRKAFPWANKKELDAIYKWGTAFTRGGTQGIIKKYSKDKEFKPFIKNAAKNFFESVNEGKKRYYQQDRVGSAKYTISYHDGKKKNKDGSDFFDIQTFKNKKDLAKFVNTLHKGGYVYGFNESVNEAASKEAMGIAALTGTRGSAVQDFIDKNRINSRKLFNALKKANLQGRLNFVSALAGKPGNPNQKLTIKLFGEDKGEVVALRKKAKSEKAFYDVLDKVEKKYGKRSFEKWLDKSLKDLKINPRKYRTSAEKQEALYQAKL